jgi:predicted anti-sigma-YlaC factor YlaD
VTRPKVTSTPVGASALAAAVVTVLMYFAGLWPPFARTPSQVQGAVQVILTAVVVYGAGYLAVVRAPGQQVRMELTPSPLPTVQLAPAEIVPAEAVQPAAGPGDAAPVAGHPGDAGTAGSDLEASGGMIP